jgi:hypothetical protein
MKEKNAALPPIEISWACVRANRKCSCQANQNWLNLCRGEQEVQLSGKMHQTENGKHPQHPFQPNFKNSYFLKFQKNKENCLNITTISQSKQFEVTSARRNVPANLN